MSPILEQDWGRVVKDSDRPILGLIKEGGFRELSVETNQLAKYGTLNNIAGALLEYGFIKINLGPRHVKRPLVSLAAPLSSILRPFTALTGLSLKRKVNTNFDFIYSSLPTLFSKGIRDYYISSDFSSIYLCH